MARIIKRRPSAAMIVAIIAVVLATAGTSIAAVTLAGFAKGARIATFGAGPLVYSSSNQFVPANTARNITVGCPPKLEAVGGGIRVSTGAQVIEGVVDSYPTNSGWAGTVSTIGSSESHTAVITAICAKTARTRGTVAGF
jgi:hypothetical protein